MKTTLALAAAAFLMGLAGQAAAQEPARSVAVSYADLDLSQAAGRAALERRIGNAAANVCSPQPSGIDLTMTHYYEQCRTDALAGARRQMAQVYDGRVLARASITVARGKR